MERVERIEGEYVDRGVVPGRSVLVEQGPTTVMIVPPRVHQAATPACTPQIDLVRDDGDVIQAIDVTCTCGQKIRLRCVYDETDAG
jgi:hypothetical protein